uniref:Uncharacterized protein n=1 Tax=Tetranychus urticae TaxID=32264 RepID=T1L581_TETUR
MLHKSNPWKRLKSHQLFQIFCVFGAIIQVSYIFKRYFSFAYSTRAIIYVPDRTELPDVIICYDMLYMVNQSKLITVYPNLFQQSKLNHSEVLEVLKNSYNGYFTNLTIKQTWNLMLSSEAAVHSAIARSAPDKGKTITYDCPFRNVFYRNAYCFVFTCWTERPAIIWSRNLYRGSQYETFFEINFHQSFFQKIHYYYLALINPKTTALGASLKWESQETVAQTQSHRYFFYSLQVDYLPKPYATNCLNYSELGYPSRIDMINQCEIKLAMELLGAPLAWSIIDYPYDKLFGKQIYDQRKEDPGYLKTVEEIVFRCFDAAKQPDCVARSFYSSIRSPIPITGNFAKISFDTIRDPIYRITYEPEMTILDALIMTGTALGTWLGFSIAVHIPRFFDSIICNCKNRKQSAGLPNYSYTRKSKLSRISPNHDRVFTLLSHSNRKESFDSQLKPGFRFPFYLYYELPNYDVKPISIRSPKSPKKSQKVDTFY